MEVSVKTNDLAQVLRLVQSVTERKATIPALGAFRLNGRGERFGDHRNGSRTRRHVSLARRRETVGIVSGSSSPLGRVREDVARGRSSFEGPSFSLAGAVVRAIALSDCRLGRRFVSRIAQATAGGRHDLLRRARPLGGKGHLRQRHGAEFDQSDRSLTQTRTDRTDNGRNRRAPSRAGDHASRHSRLGENYRDPHSQEGLDGVPAVFGRQKRPGCPLLGDRESLVFRLERAFATEPETGCSFPNYERVLPKQYGRSISLERKESRASIERVSSFSDTKTRCIVVEVSQRQLALRAEDSNVGESEEVLPVTYNDEPMRIGFNASYLAGFLAVSNTSSSSSCFRTDRVLPNCGRTHWLGMLSIGIS